MEILLAIASLHRIAADEAKPRHEFGHVRFDTPTIQRAALLLGMSTKAIRQDLGRLDKAPLPAIAQMRDDGGYILVGQYRAGEGSHPDRLLIQHPGKTANL